MEEVKVVVSPPGYSGFSCWRIAVEGHHSNRTHIDYPVKGNPVCLDFKKENDYGLVYRDEFDSDGERVSSTLLHVVDKEDKDNKILLEGIGKMARDEALCCFERFRIEEVDTDGGLVEVLRE